MREKFAASNLLIEQIKDTEESDGGMSFDLRALKRQKLNDRNKAGKHMDARFCVPSSNVCERLFSTAGHLSSARRKRNTPENLDSQIFLHLNRDLWGATDFNELTFD